MEDMRVLTSFVTEEVLVGDPDEGVVSVLFKVPGGEQGFVTKIAKDSQAAHVLAQIVSGGGATNGTEPSQEVA